MEPQEQEYVMQKENYSIRNFNDTLSQTFTRMFMGLLLTAVTAIVTYRTPLIYSVIGYYGLFAIAELVVVFVFSLGFRKMSASTVSVLYYVYAVLNGLTFSTIFKAYDLALIGKSFLITAAMFGVLAYYGHTTDKDLSSWGTILSIGLIMGIIATIINMFLKNDLFSIALDWIMLAIFSLLTIYDMNKMKYLSESIEGNGEPDKLYVYCAMQLYLDFINIFLRILSIMSRGNRK